MLDDRVISQVLIFIWDQPFSTYVKFSEKTNISNPLIRTRTYHGGRNISFSENFAYVVNDALKLEYENVVSIFFDHRILQGRSKGKFKTTHISNFF